MAEGETTARTNSLCVHFPEPLSVASAYKELSKFGELSCVEVPPGQYAVAVVSFYDIRAASRAKAALGGRCAEAPDHGERTVLLKGDVQIHAWMIEEISAIRKSSDGSTYFLDFFDTRAAERAAAQFDTWSITELEDSSCETGAKKEAVDALGGNGGVGAPRYRNDLRLSQVNWADLASGREWRTTLRLRCLPRALCEEAALQSLLFRAGLAEGVDCVRVFPGEGKRLGSALINTVDGPSAAAVVKYMHGRQFGRGGGGHARPMPISVSFAALQGATEVQKAFPKAAARTQNLAKAAEALPWRVETTGEELGVSEASTEAGDETEFAASDQGHAEAPAAPQLC